MTWRVPNLWEGGECWILGGGPSLPRQFDVPEQVIQDVMAKKLPLSAYSPHMSAIHEKHVIGVNMAFLIGDWIDMVFWGDKKWYLSNRVALADFKGLKVTCHPYFADHKRNGENVKHVAKDNNHPRGISDDPRKAAWNANSGAAAISVAANMGATKIILVGFDMRLGTDQKQHWHTEYGTAGRTNVPSAKLPFHRHLLGFPIIAKDARKRGITIINACPDSTIPDFPKMSVQSVLNGSEVPVVKNSNPMRENRPMRGKRRKSANPNVKRVVDGFKVMKPTEPGKRFNWLSGVIKERGYATGAEVGCANGVTTEFILRYNTHLKLYAVDLWGPVPKSAGGGRQYRDWNFVKLKNRFNQGIRPFRHRVVVLRGLSWEMADQVEDGSLDFVFLDADHEYESVIKDIRAWTPKLKPGGMMSGHDTHFEDVLKAIQELIPDFVSVGIDHCWEAKKEDVIC